MAARHLRTSVTLLAFAAATLAGCDEPEPSKAAPRVKRQAPAVESVVGVWTIDTDAFLEENWKLMASASEPAMERLRAGEARIAAMPPAEQAAARAQVDAKIAALPAEQQAMVRAVLQGPEELKAATKAVLAQQLHADALRLEFRQDGSCTLRSALPGQSRSEAEGTWTATGSGVSVTLGVVDGKAAKGADLKPMTMQVKGGRLRFKPKTGGPTIVAKRV